MNYRKFFPQTIGFALFMLFFTACGASQLVPTPIPSTLTQTPVPPAATPLPPTVTATIASTSTPLPVTAATVITAQGDKEWDLVVMGDSLMGGLTSRYVAHLEQDLGIRVIVHNRIRDGCGSSCLLKPLGTNSELQQYLREAEVVIFDVGLEVFKYPVWQYAFDSPGSCGGTDNQDCLREALKVYKEDTDAIFAEIVSLCSPSETLIRTMDTYQFMVKELKEADAFDVINNYQREANEHVTQVATEHHIPVAQVYAAFMGSNGDEDPRDKGLVQNDGVHPTGEGTDLMAELFRELGYEYAPLEP
jgi:hypothetical protein